MQILGQLLFDGDADIAVAEMSPWLDLRVPPKHVKLPLVDAILEHSSFAWMKQNATRSVPLGGAFWDAGAEVFIHKGVNGRWKDVLTAAESAEYEARAEAELGAECARWLATGEGLSIP